MNNTRIPVIVIFAPTASGKTALTRELFCKSGSHFILNAEIVSADSQAVYKGMDIGTAKPDADLCKELPHHIINLVEPDVQFTVADFVTAADKACQEIYERGNVPVVCGGTGFYIRCFLFGLPVTPESNPQIREQIKNRIEKEGNEALYAELQVVDPQSAAVISPNDAYRICRALEVFYTTGKIRSSYVVSKQLREMYDFKFIVLEPPRKLLYERIGARVEWMFENGLEAEVRELIQKGYTKDTPGMKAIGYSEWFDEASDINEIKAAIIHHSCKYAKKQFTYIRDIPGSIILPFSSTEQDIAKVAELLICPSKTDS
ncbi:MAG: tRNA (adenosine(37)-N6)-dimethylallyltransferase MiaA [Treponema sp.]|nr:tRNA (adenosine(37)-N6)-dimethylallyltransferase MiaA [Treponema sp.]